MQNKANHNSILLLTTLGVYIGLLLVGAPTGVIAQPAAMTRNFQLSDEIESKDDLDNDPNGDQKAVQELFDFYLESVDWFVDDIRGLVREKGFVLPSNPQEVTDVSSFPCTNDQVRGGVGEGWFLVWDEHLEEPFRALQKRIWDFHRLAVCETHPKIRKSKASTINAEISFDAERFLVKVSFKTASEKSASRMLSYLQDAAKDYYSENFDDHDYTNRLYFLKFTTFKSDNDQIFVVTRLPRAGLESLIASNAK